MNKLTRDLPKAVMIDGVRYPINTASRNCFLIIEALENDELFDIEKWEILLENFYQEPYPNNLQKAFEMFEKFLKQCENNSNKSEPQYIDFMKDSKIIYDALLSNGLTNEQIKSFHWWDLMSKLSEVKETRFNRIVYLRMQNHKGKLTKEEKEECKKIGWDIIKINRIKISNNEKEHYEKLLND